MSERERMDPEGTEERFDQEWPERIYTTGGDDPFRAIHAIARRHNMALVPGQRVARGLEAATHGGSRTANCSRKK